MKHSFKMFCVMLGFSMGVNAAPVSNGVPENNLSATTGNTLAFELSVPAGATNVNVAISGGSGDADLYVRANSVPTTSTYDCRPYLIGNNETCNFTSPQATTYYINVRAYESFSGLNLLATYSGGSSDGGGSSGSNQELTNGQIRSNLSGAANSQTMFTINVPSNAHDLMVTMSGGTGDADLFVRFAAAPTTGNYNCRPYLEGNNESCPFTNPQTGTYYIMVRGYSAFSGLSLTANYSVSESGGGNGSTWSGFESYYANAIGQNGSTLLNALHEAAARHHSRMTYSQVWDALKYTDEDPNNSNNVILIYTGRSQAKTFNASGNNDPDAWNREHSWPKSHGFPDSGDWAYTDIHHLRPSDASVNSSRGNKDYDNGGSAIGEAPGNYTDSDSFEPRNQVKGDLARMMFYMHVRYNGFSNGNDNTGTEDLNLVDYTGTSGANLGKICTLISWHNQDPVSTEEINRHARIVERQGNRNPFVDYPAWANEVWGSECN